MQILIVGGVFMDIYDRIDELLKQKKSNRKEMACLIDIPYNTISSLFIRRSKGMNLVMLQKIADYLDTTMDYLVYGNEKEKPTSKLAGLKLEMALNEVGIKMSDLDNLSPEQSKLIAAATKSFLNDRGKG